MVAVRSKGFLHSGPTPRGRAVSAARAVHTAEVSRTSESNLLILVLTKCAKGEARKSRAEKDRISGRLALQTIAWCCSTCTMKAIELCAIFIGTKRVCNSKYFNRLCYISRSHHYDVHPTAPPSNAPERLSLSTMFIIALRQQVSSILES